MTDHAYTIGDTITCKIDLGKILEQDAEEFEQIHKFDIVCFCGSGYLILVPQALFLKNSFTLTNRDIKDFDILPRFKDGLVHFIRDNHIVGLQKRLQGLRCFKCGEWQEFGEINRLDDNGHGILICWSCRTYPYR